jgi:general secretion pathway protein E
MVGEIRDRETAEIAIHASLTGHLVLSTIHTNDSASAVTRLVEMEIEPFLVRSSVIGILAQRLVRVLCPHCKVPYAPNDYELKQMGLDEERLDRKARRVPSDRYAIWGQEYDWVGKGHDQYVFHKQGGCEACGKKGFVGRRAIYELLMIDDAVGPLILKSSDAQTLKRVAISQGMDTMRDDGARKVLAGLTTVEEVLAATQEDILLDE